MTAPGSPIIVNTACNWGDTLTMPEIDKPPAESMNRLTDAERLRRVLWMCRRFLAAVSISSWDYTNVEEIIEERDTLVRLIDATLKGGPP